MASFFKNLFSYNPNYDFNADEELIPNTAKFNQSKYEKFLKKLSTPGVQLTPKQKEWLDAPAQKKWKESHANEQTDNSKLQQILTWAGANGLPPKPPITQTVFDLISTQAFGKWTLSEFQKFGDWSNYERIPHVILTEYSVNSSSTVQSLRVMGGAIKEIGSEITSGAGAAAGAGAGAGEKVLPRAVSDIISDITTVVKDGITETLAGITNIAKNATGQEDHPDLLEDGTNNHLGGSRYRFLYSITETGYSYILPYFSETYFNIANSWSDSSRSTSKAKKRTDDFVTSSLDTAAAPGYWDPGVYIERPKYYNFDFGNEIEINVNFPLINTHKFEDVNRNIQLIKNLVIQNLVYRKSITRSQIPVIYDVKIPGVAHHPFCYIKKLDIKHVGNKRLTTEFNNGTPTLIPDAYMVNITLVSLVLNASNFYLEAFGNNINGIQVTTHLSPAAAARKAGETKKTAADPAKKP